jgi:hypothetical protein
MDKRRFHTNETKGGEVMDSKQPKGGIFLGTLCAIFFFLWGGFLIVDPAVAAEITVCYPSGCNATTIQDGINMASSGDTVLVSAGTYNENIGIITGVNVVSKGDDTTTSYTGSGHTTTALKRATETIIDGGGSDSVVRILGGTTPDVTLDGFTIQNAGVADMFLIRIGGGSPTVKNNIIRNNTGTGLHSGGIGLQGILGVEVSPTIENNLIHNVHGPGIGNGPNSHAMIRNNEIWDCNSAESPGIGLWGYAYPTIENNTIFGNGTAGIGSCYHMAGCPEGLQANGGILTIPTIKGNTIYENWAGIRLVRADGDTGTINVTIGDSDSGNIIYDSFVSGIGLDGITSASIHNNQIYNQMWAGIRLDNINDITISNNDIHHSNGMAGIIFYSNVENANVDHNQIHENGKAGIRNRGAATLIVQNNNEIYLNNMGGINIDYSGSTNTIQQSTIRDNLFGGIRVASAASVTVQDNNIYGNGYGGINNEAINTLSVTGNQIYDNGYGGINIKSGTGTITQNTIEQNQRGGIAIKAPCTFEITNNGIHDNLRGGIHTGDDSAGGGYTGVPGDAHLTIKKNKIYGNGPTGYGGGVDVRHADGVINNNLVYDNHRAGIRFGDWIDEIVNNTVVGNGTNATLPGAGIVYDDLAGAVNAGPGGCATTDIPIKNNICTNNEKAGIRIKICPNACPNNRDYNLLCRNHGISTDTCIAPPYYCEYMQLYMCPRNGNEIFANPLFVNAASDDYHLQGTSPAKNAGDDLTDMGAYGGSDPIAW